MPKNRRNPPDEPIDHSLQALNRKAIRQALRFWGSSQKLGEHDLAKLDIVEARRKAAGYGQTKVGCGVALREVLHDAILKLKPDSGEPDWQEKSWRPYLILSQQYLNGRSPSYLIEQLNIARSTYDHEQAQAFENLADILRQWEEIRSQPTPPVAAPVAVPFLAPPCPPQPLLGREGVLASLKQALLVREGLAAAALDGLPGAGKTALAVELAHDPEILDRFSEGVLWASLGPHPDVPALLGTWAAALGLSPEDIAKMAQVEKRAAALHAAFGLRRVLLVIDNAWKTEDALAFKVGGPHCAYLVTTRLPKVALDFAGHRAVTIHELSEDDGLALLAHFAPEVVASEPAEARALVKAVGSLPLALVLMGKYLQQEARSGQPRRLRAAVGQLQQAGARLQLKQAPAPLEQQPSQLLAAIAVSDQALDENARRALRALAVFPPKPNSFAEAAALVVGAAPAETLDRLTDYGLLECPAQGRYALHQTIAEYAGFPARDEAAAERLAAYYIRYAEAHTTDYEALNAEASNCLFSLQVAVERQLRAELIRGANVCYGFLASRGAYTLARAYLSQAAEAARALNDTLSLITTLSNLGQATQRQGEFAQAEVYYQEALALARKLGERESLSHVLQGLGAVAFSQGQIVQAEAYYQEGLALARAIHSQSALCALYGNLGVLLFSRGDYGQAETYFSEGLTLARAMDHRPRTSALLTNLGVVAARRGEFARADAYFQESLQLARASGHRENICLLLINLGSLASDRQDLAAAKAYFEEGLDLGRQLGTPVQVSHLLANLGALALRQKDFALAGTYLQEGLSLARLTRHRENIALNLTNLGQWALGQGQSAQAETYLQEGLMLAREMGHRRYVGIILNHLGELYLKREKWPEAEAAFGEAHSLAQNLNAFESLGLARFGLARLAAHHGRQDQAREMGRGSLQILEPLRHPQAAAIRAWLGEDSAP